MKTRRAKRQPLRTKQEITRRPPVTRIEAATHCREVERTIRLLLDIASDQDGEAVAKLQEAHKNIQQIAWFLVQPHMKYVERMFAKANNSTLLDRSAAEIGVGLVHAIFDTMNDGYFKTHTGF